MTEQHVFDMMARLGVVPVIAIDAVDAALALADALKEGGLPVIEITFRTAAAADVIRTLVRQRPELLVGAGTVLTEENLVAARQSGAAFGVAPGLNPAVVRRAQEMGLPFLPGVATASEIEQGLALGCRTLKFFPAEALGGPNMLKALAAPFAHTGVRFVPTGGINASNLEAYLRLDCVVAVGGTWIAKKEDIALGRWAEIAQRCREAVDLVCRVRA